MQPYVCQKPDPSHHGALKTTDLAPCMPLKTIKLPAVLVEHIPDFDN